MEPYKPNTSSPGSFLLTAATFLKKEYSSWTDSYLAELANYMFQDIGGSIM